MMRKFSLSTNVFINNLPERFTKQELVYFASPYGKIMSAKVIIDLTTGISKGYGFVRYDSVEAARNAIQAINMVYIDGKKLVAKFADSIENTGERTKSIYVKSLPLYTTKSDIWALFSKFGKIVGIKLDCHKNNKKHFNGAATITFTYCYEAEEAVRVMNNQRLTPESWPLFIQYTDDHITMESENESFQNGIKVTKPSVKKNMTEIDNKKKELSFNYEMMNWGNYYESDDFMFKMIAEEL